ncbi:hypothetical protein F383_29737 [Gossypium arboreum]|uniref:Uncharacterized protein n=1 Tax=Gossypium arboreum TaxID=29729 RepID=A0A0B0MHM7_GOSAR|nr:hypothetical protein F383_21169 [Gossypium arboreum]KHG03983.1 hypothetical protein F383_29737 [Gossypium arboreum]
MQTVPNLAIEGERQYGGVGKGARERGRAGKLLVGAQPPGTVLTRSKNF